MHNSRQKTGGNRQKTLWGLNKNTAYKVSITLSIVLCIFCILWETVIAPVHPGGSWLALKCIPLAFTTYKLKSQKVKSFQAMTLLVWLYVFEGLTRLASDPTIVSRLCGVTEVCLCLLIFYSSTVFIRLPK